MPARSLYGVSVWLTSESARRSTPDMSGGVQASTPDRALQCFMQHSTLSYVEMAIVLHISEKGVVLSGECRDRVMCSRQKQEVK